jgi:type I site-specific restriction endonuclease
MDAASVIATIRNLEKQVESVEKTYRSVRETNGEQARQAKPTPAQKKDRENQESQYQKQLEGLLMQRDVAAALAEMEKQSEYRTYNDLAPNATEDDLIEGLRRKLVASALGSGEMSQAIAMLEQRLQTAQKRIEALRVRLQQKTEPGPSDVKPG